jgi:hypothetical protein
MSLVSGTASFGRSPNRTTKKLVLAITNPQKLTAGLHHLPHLISHAATRVQQESNGNRHIFPAEVCDSLFHTVLEELKVFAVETADGGSAPIVDLDRYHDQGDIHVRNGKCYTTGIACRGIFWLPTGIAL